MATTSYPFEDQDTTESQYSALFRELQDTGVVGGFGEAALRVSADSTGMNVKVAPGSAIVRGHFLASTAVETLPIEPASSQPRVDVVVARLDPTANKITLEVVTGAPAVTPSAPALTRTETGVFEEPLAVVAVSASAATIASSAVSDKRRYIGHRVGVWSSDTQPVSPRRGRLGLNTSTNRWEYWTGTAWTDLAPIVTWASITGRPSTFAPSAHSHNASDITGTLALARIPALPVSQLTSGTLPISRGGTGGASAAAARSALGITPGTIGAATTAYAQAIRRDVDWLNNNWATKANVSHTHVSSQVSHAGTRLDTWWNAVDASFDTVRRDITWLNNNYQYASGPTSWAYNRNAGDARYAVYMDGALGFGRNVSSRRYKDQIQPAEVDVAAVLALEPVTYHRINDPEGVRDLGLIAEDATAVEHLVIYDRERDEDGNVVEGAEARPEAVRYEQSLVVALLAVCKAQQAQIDELAARVREVVS